MDHTIPLPLPQYPKTIKEECPWCAEWAAGVIAPDHALASVLWEKLYRNHLKKTCSGDGGRFGNLERFDVVKWFWEALKDEQ